MILLLITVDVSTHYGLREFWTCLYITDLYDNITLYLIIMEYYRNLLFISIEINNENQPNYLHTSHISNIICDYLQSFTWKCEFLFCNNAEMLYICITCKLKI